MADNEAFWVVWAPDFGPPRVKHELECRAENEAKRLARQSPGHSFYVLKAMSCTVKDDVRTERLEDRSDEHIPF